MAKKRKQIAPELNALRGRIREMKYTQKELAQEIGITPNTLSNLINGYSSIDGLVIEKIVNVLEIQVDEIPKFFFPALCETHKGTSLKKRTSKWN